MTYYAQRLLLLLGRWSVGSIQKFAEELHVDPSELAEPVVELQQTGYLVAYAMNDRSFPTNKMLEITQKGIDFMETYDGQINQTL